MRSPVFVGLLLLPSLLMAQEGPPEVRAQIDSLLSMARIEAALAGLDERFLGNVRLLAPDLTPSDGEILADAIREAFAAPAIRGDVLSTLAAEASPDDVAALLL